MSRVRWGRFVGMVSLTLAGGCGSSTGDGANRYYCTGGCIGGGGTPFVGYLMEDTQVEATTQCEINNGCSSANVSNCVCSPAPQ